MIRLLLLSIIFECGEIISDFKNEVYYVKKFGFLFINILI